MAFALELSMASGLPACARIGHSQMKKWRMWGLGFQVSDWLSQKVAALWPWAHWTWGGLDWHAHRKWLPFWDVLSPLLPLMTVRSHLLDLSYSIDIFQGFLTFPRSLFLVWLSGATAGDAQVFLLTLYRGHFWRGSGTYGVLRI